MKTEAFDDQISRLELMADDVCGDKWDLSPNDRAAIAEILVRWNAMKAASIEVALIIERSHGDNVGFAEADMLRAAIEGVLPPLRQTIN